MKKILIPLILEGEMTLNMFTKLITELKLLMSNFLEGCREPWSLRPRAQQHLSAGIRLTWVLCPVLAFTGWLTRGKLLQVSGLHFLFRAGIATTPQAAVKIPWHNKYCLNWSMAGVESVLVPLSLSYINRSLKLSRATRFSGDRIKLHVPKPFHPFLCLFS